MAKEKRFIEMYTEGTFATTTILVDTITGVNYLRFINGYAGGICPLLDADGKPIITPVELYKDI